MAGRWDEPFPGVLRIAGAPQTWRQMLMAACFAAASGALVSHRASAAMRLLPGFDEGVLEISAPRGSKRALFGPSVVVHHPRILGRNDATRIDGIPVTSIERTLIDVAAQVPVSTLEEAIDHALRTKLTSVRRLRARAESLGRSGRTGAGIMRELLEARGPQGPQSVLETKVLRMIRSAGLPVPVLQHRIRNASGALSIVDFAYPRARVAIEANGYRWHSSRAQWQRDMTRRNALTALGWRVVDLSWDDVAHRPDRAIRAIQALGVTGQGGRRSGS